MKPLPLLLAVLTFAGPVAAAEPVTISFYQRGYVAGAGTPPVIATDKAVALFEQRNPDVKVKIVGIPYSEEGDKLFEAALSSRVVDMGRMTSIDLPRYARAGLLSEVGPHLTPEDKDDIYPAALQAASYDGQIWAWPLWVTAVTVIANTDLLKERGVALPTFEKPWSFDRFAKDCGKLTFTRPDGVKVHGLNYGLSVPALFYIDGGRVISSDGRKVTVNQKEGVSALNSIARLHGEQHCVPADFMAADEPRAREQFEKGEVAMLLSPPGYIRVLAARKFPFVVLPLPVGRTGKPVTTGAFGLYAAGATGDEARGRAAHRLARWMTGSEVGALVPDYQLAPGLRKSNTNLDGDALFAPISAAVKYGVYESPNTVPDAVLRVGLTEAMRAAVFGEVPAQKALDEYAPKLQAALDAANSGR